MDQKHNQDLFEALSNASDNVYIFQNNMETGISRWSENAVAYFGLPPEYATNTLEVWLPRIHPQDREDYLQDVQAVFTGEKERHCVQYRVKNGEGEYVWVECTGNVVKDETGKLLLFAGIIIRIDNQTKYDPLTKQLSIHQFYTYEQLPEKSWAVLIGMDEFRRVIHKYGYEAGDDILTMLSEAIDESIDVEEAEVFRMEGDGFLVLLPKFTKTRVKRYYKEVAEAFQKKLNQEDYSKQITFCAGAAECILGECNKEMLIRRLEHAMTQAKSRGKGTLVFYAQEIEEQQKRDTEVAEALQRAIGNNFQGFELYYQPILSNDDGVIRTAEALLRFHCDSLGWISPAEFIPILEGSGEIRPVGRWVMEQAVHQSRVWNQKYRNITVGFNVSYLQMYNDSLVKHLIRTVEKEGIEPSHITVELTESCKVLYPESLAGMFHEMKEYGFKVALDDFGMEYSSFSLIRDLPITTVKIDHSFVRTISGNGSRLDKANLAIISGIITMAKNLNYRVVVEGIENERTAALIGVMGVDYLQGYYYSKPVPPEEVEKLFPPK